MNKVDNEGMRRSVNEIIDNNSSVLALKSDVHHLTLIQEQMQTDIKLILDAVIPAQNPMQ